MIKIKITKFEWGWYRLHMTTWPTLTLWHLRPLRQGPAQHVSRDHHNVARQWVELNASAVLRGSWIPDRKWCDATHHRIIIAIIFNVLSLRMQFFTLKRKLNVLQTKPKIGRLWLRLLFPSYSQMNFIHLYFSFIHKPYIRDILANLNIYIFKNGKA